MNKNVLFFLPTLNSYIDRVITVSSVSKFKINFVFIKNDNKELEEKILKKGHKIFFISKIIKNKFLRILLNPLIIIFLALKTKSKIIHLTSYAVNPLIMKIFCQLTRRKYYVSLFILYSDRFKLFRKLSLFDKLKSQQIRRMYFFTIHEFLLLPSVDKLIMQAHGIAESLPLFEKYKNKIKIIPNGIETNDLPKWHAKSKSSMNRPLNLIYAGGIDSTRGVDILINAFNELCNKNINVELTLIGEKGDYFSDKLKFSIPQKVKILSKLKRADLYLEILKNDLFVYPTKNEGSPRIILEMLSIGIPILSTTLPGIIELDKKKEFINYISNKESIIKKIIEYKNNPDSFYERANSGMIHIRKWNNANKVSKIYEELYSY